MSEWLKYCRAFKSDLDVWAVWQPGDPISLFDYGYIENERWVKLGSLWDLVQCTESDLIEESAKADIQLGKGKLLNIKNSLELNSVLNAGIKISFESENNIFLSATGSKTQKIKKLQTIKTLIEKIYSSKWDKDWFLVSALRTSEGFSVLVSNSNNSEIEINAESSELQEFISGTIKSKNSLRITGSVGFSIVGQSGPIHFDLVKFKKRFFSSELDIKRMGENISEQEIIIEKISPQDYEY